MPVSFSASGYPALKVAARAEQTLREVHVFHRAILSCSRSSLKMGSLFLLVGDFSVYALECLSAVLTDK